jgi:hypothetical protein
VYMNIRDPLFPTRLFPRTLSSGWSKDGATAGLHIYVATCKMSNELHNDSDANAISPPMVLSDVNPHHNGTCAYSAWHTDMTMYRDNNQE